MIRLTRPTTDVLDRYVRDQERETVFTGNIRIPARPPAGFVRNHYRGCLGCGAAAFAAARTAVSQWKQFPGGWIDVHPAHGAAHLDQTVAVVARCLGLWSVNACRVTGLSEDDGNEMARFAITYATLSGHMLVGAECFCVEWDKSDDRVWYDLSSYARPQHWLARAIFPAIRGLQRRFARDSLAALQAATTAMMQDGPSHPVTCRESGDG